MTPAPRRRRFLPALVSIRFLAAFHLVLFHLLEGHRALRATGNPALTNSVWDALPAPLIRLVEHGYAATSLFFLLSGFILAHVHVDQHGRLDSDAVTFLKKRLVRIYPYHLLALVLAAPASLVVIHSMKASVAEAASALIFTVLMVQAWTPSRALFWNFPTWALSVVVFFYLTFPGLVDLLEGRQRTTLARILIGLIALAWIPPFLFHLTHPDGGRPMQPLYETLARHPLLWWPHFAIGVVFRRMLRLESPDPDPADAPLESDAGRTPLSRASSAAGALREGPAAGDLSAGVVVILLMTGIDPGRFMLRQAVLIPFYLAILGDLARGRGHLARILSTPLARALGQTSYAIFLLQLPIQSLVAAPFWVLPAPELPVFLLVPSAIVGGSWLWFRFVEAPMNAWLRRRTGPATREGRNISARDA